jgi:hypothetical protein
MVTPDNYAVAIMVPAAMPPAVMTIKFDPRAAIVITVAVVIVAVRADAETETLSARHCRRGNRDGRQRGENAINLLHVTSPIVVAQEENGWDKATFLELLRNFF